jgi:probable HAF family extracellular repeat protein
MAQEDFEEPVWSPATHSYDLTRSQLGRSGIPVRLITLLSATMALAMLACTSEEATTEPSGGPSLARGGAGTYTAVDLGILDIPQGFASFSLASDINDAGQVVGVSTAPQTIPTPRGQDLASHAFLWDKGIMTDLGTLGGPFSLALGINPSGQVVGWSFVPDAQHPGFMKHAFLWKNGVMTDLGTLGGPESLAWDINPRGQVVGVSEIGGGITAPFVFLWEKGVITGLGFEARTNESSVGINPAGRVVGGGKLWDNGVVTDLGTLGGCCTSANAINPAGQVVGLSYLPGNEVYHAFRWDKGVMTDLGTLGGNSEARGINSRGQIVGQSGNRAFVWERGVMTELISLDSRFNSQAEAINAAGQIVGYSNTEAGLRATLWTHK